MKQLFCYAFRNAGVLAAGASANNQIDIGNDADFEVKEIRTTGTNGMRVTLSESGGENYSNIAFNAGFVGTGQNALKLFDRWVIPANTTINALIDNQTGGGVTDFEIQIWGYKIK